MKTFYVKKQYEEYPSEDNFKLVEEDIPHIKDGGTFFAWINLFTLPNYYYWKFIIHKIEQKFILRKFKEII